MTTIQITPIWYDVKPSLHYVYIHTRGSDGSPFYVGMGQGRRGWSSGVGSRSPWWIRVGKKNGCRIEIAQDGLSRDQAMLLEMWLIAKLRHAGERLVNMTDGGEGAIGVKQTEETIRKRTKRGKEHHFFGKKMSPEHCKNLSLSHIGKMKGRDSPTYKVEEFNFWHIDGRSFTGTRNEFQYYSGLTSGGVSRIVLGGRNHEKGWYVSEFRRDPKEVMDRRIFLPDGSLANGMSVYSNLGESFPSGAEAALVVGGRGASGDLIIAACRGVYVTAYGRTWSFNKDGPFKEYIDPRRVSGNAKFKNIECSNGMVFLGAKAASDWVSKECGRTVTCASLYQAIRTQGKTGGYSWRYING